MPWPPGTCFAVIQTGPWEGEGSWLYRMYCHPHCWEDLADNRDDAVAAVHQHRQEWDGVEVEEF